MPLHNSSIVIYRQYIEYRRISLYMALLFKSFFRLIRAPRKVFVAAENAMMDYLGEYL